LAKTAERVQALQQEYEILRDKVAQENIKAQKIENKVTLLTTGYLNRAKTLESDISELHFNYNHSIIEHDCFKILESQENNAMPIRLQRIKDEVAVEKSKESSLQSRYAALVAEKNQLLSLLSND